MIGKFYRPLKIESLIEKRGYKIKHKYKSNFGGKKTFEQILKLEYNIMRKKDFLVFNFNGLDKEVKLIQKQYKKAPILINEDKNKNLNYKISNKEVTDYKEKKEKITHLRNIYRPINIYSGKELTMAFIVHSADFKDEKTDIIEIKMSFRIKDNEEYLEIIVISDIPAQIN